MSRNQIANQLATNSFASHIITNFQDSRSEQTTKSKCDCLVTFAINVNKQLALLVAFLNQFPIT